MELRQAVDSFLAELAAQGKSENTTASYQRHLALWVEFCEANNFDYRAVNGKETKAFRNYLSARTTRTGHRAKATSVNAALSALKSFYDYLAVEGVVKANPIITKAVRVKEEKSAPRFLGDNEARKVQEWVTGLRSPAARLAFNVMFATALRVSEVAGIGPEDVLEHEGKVFIRVVGKGNKTRVVPVLDGETAKALLAAKTEAEAKGADRLFPAANTLKVHAANCRKATGVGFSCHKARHTVATNLLAGGTRLDVIQKLLGHSNISTTTRYAKTLDEDLFRLAAAAGGQG